VSVFQALFRMALPIAIFMAWIFFTSEYRDQKLLHRLTEQIVKADDRLIQRFVRKYQVAPPTMSDLRIFAKLTNRRFQSYDSWGNRLDYLPLGRVNYTLRSYGADGLQNTRFLETDPGVFHWGFLVEKGLRYDFNGTQTRPPAVVFSGSDDAAQRWHGSIFLDQATGVRRLLVRNRQNEKIYMIAPHDGVEEFLWLPQDDQLVFTASGSARYGDGVWIWDLRTDEIWNLLDTVSQNAGASWLKQTSGFYSALSFVKHEGGVTYIGAFVVPMDRSGLTARTFFSATNLRVFELLGRENARLLELTANLPVAIKFLSNEEAFRDDYGWLSAQGVLNQGGGTPLQVQWLSLPRTGNWEDAMQIWQDFAARHQTSPLSAYSIWALSQFYRDASMAHQTANAKTALVLWSFAKELDLGVKRMLSAPSWMRSLELEIPTAKPPKVPK
jgi:hypothetical protein